MKTWPAITAALFLSSCASSAGNFTPDIKEQWRQRDFEAGTLPVGRIASIERLAAQRQTYREAPPLQPAISSPAVALAAAIITPALNSARNTDVAFRHSILMQDGTTLVLDLPYAFDVGECVAFRPGLQGGVSTPIPALPGECERAAAG